VTTVKDDGDSVSAIASKNTMESAAECGEERKGMRETVPENWLVPAVHRRNDLTTCARASFSIRLPENESKDEGRKERAMAWASYFILLGIPYMLDYGGTQRVE